MNKKQFLSELERALRSLSDEDRQDILRDIEEYFHEAARQGRSEEEVLKKLGSPKAFAATIIAEAKVTRINDAKTFSQKISAVFGALMAIVVLTPFNLIFILFPLAFITFFLMFGWIFTLVATLSTPIILLVCMVMMFQIGFKLFVLLSLIFFAFGWLSMVVAIVAAFVYVTMCYFKGISKFFSWNIQFIKNNMKG